MAEAESRRAADAAEQAYRDAFNRDISADEGQLDAEHARALAVAQSVFNDKAVGEAAFGALAFAGLWTSREAVHTR